MSIKTFLSKGTVIGRYKGVDYLFTARIKKLRETS